MNKAIYNHVVGLRGRFLSRQFANGTSETIKAWPLHCVQQKVVYSRNGLAFRLSQLQLANSSLKEMRPSAVFVKLRTLLLVHRAEGHGARVLAVLHAHLVPHLVRGEGRLEAEIRDQC
jgi:hypothetical protein